MIVTEVFVVAVVADTTEVVGVVGAITVVAEVMVIVASPGLHLFLIRTFLLCLRRSVAPE